MTTRHVLAPPWDLPGTLDEVLETFLEEEELEPAAQLLEDQAYEPRRDPRLRALLGHVRLRLATETAGLEEGLPLTAKALKDVESALEAGVDAEALEPLLREIRRVLDAMSRKELEVLEAVRPGADLTAVKPDVLEEAAWILRSREPARAAALFDTLAVRQGDKGFESRMLGGLSRREAGDVTGAMPVLEEATTYDWRAAGLWHARLTTEAAFTALLEDAIRGRDLPRFHELWSRAVERMDQLGRRFPAVWKNQERLLELCLVAGDADRAQVVAKRIRADRPYVNRALGRRLEAAEKLAEA